MKATEQYFPVVLFIMLYKVILTFESVDEILKYDHSNENSLVVLLHGNICFSAFENMEIEKKLLKFDMSHLREGKGKYFSEAITVSGPL